MIRTTILALLLAASQPVVSECIDTNEELETPCYNYNGLTFDISADRCRSNTVFNNIKPKFDEYDKALPKRQRCKGGFMREIRALMGTFTNDGAITTIHDMCEEALYQAATEDGHVDFALPNIDLGEYFEGNGFLNKETGNFQQEENDFVKRGGYNTFLTISDDPTKNDHYTTSDESYAAGVAIKELYEDVSKYKFFNEPSGFQLNCASNAAMCCWHRDRQYFDNNGSCQHRDCANENPGDNTDLCWTEHDNEVYPYPGDGTEKALHCHGLSWNDHVEDINTKGKWNAMFYVSMYDHLYQRGYVESVTNDAKIAGDIPMCGCIEDMAPVARADCQQVDATVEYTGIVEDDKFKIMPKTETFELEFNSCEGLEYKEGLTPQEYEAEKGSTRFKTSNNDLAAFVYKQWLEGKITDDHVAAVEEKLIGYRDPSVKNNDNKREEACKAAFEKKYPNKPYEEIPVAVETEIDA